MDTRTFDAMTRRASLLTLGAAGLATLGSLWRPLAAGARKRNGKKAKKENKKFDQRCKKQVGPCESVLTANCNGDPGCLRGVPCCSFFGKCDGVGFVTCVIESQQPEPEGG